MSPIPALQKLLAHCHEEQPSYAVLPIHISFLTTFSESEHFNTDMLSASNKVTFICFLILNSHFS